LIEKVIKSMFLQISVIEVSQVVKCVLLDCITWFISLSEDY